MIQESNEIGIISDKQPEIWATKLSFKNGTTITLNQNDIIVFVGPNNAGKSVSLREIFVLLKNANDSQTKILNQVESLQDGEWSDLEFFLEANTKKEFNQHAQPFYKIDNVANVHSSSAKLWWNNLNAGLYDIIHLFIKHLTTESRLATVTPPNNINLIAQLPSHPIHYLQKDDKIETNFSNYFKQAFGTDLIVHRNAGNIVPLYVGKKPIPEEGEDRCSIGYLKNLEKLDLLHEQGDGMKSFVGVLLNAFVSKQSILLIDEPEAFLHPPQARLLGKMLVKNLPKKKQLFLATHSEDFLKGLLDSDSPNLKIVRIQRNGNTNDIHILNSHDITQIWSDSLLRHSNVLNGLFHSKVIICESDSDCRFYSAILSSLYESSDEIAPDVLFIHCGGKDRLHVAIKALRKLGVDLKVIADFDVLNNEHTFKKIFIELGGDWKEIKDYWSRVKISIDDKRPELLSEDIKKQLDSIFSENSTPTLSKTTIAEIQKLLKKASAWSEAKSSGRYFIPPGEATKAFNEMQSIIKNTGLFIVEVGEVEGFVKSEGNHGPKWINSVLTKDLINDPEFIPAKNFIREVVT